MWKVLVETNDGEKKEFFALSTYELTPEQKLLWQTKEGQEEKVTNLRIKAIIERKVDGGEQKIS